MIYNTFPQGIFCSFNFVLMLGLGNTICSLVGGIVCFLVLEHPTKRLLEWTVLPYVSHDELLHQEFSMNHKLMRMAEAQRQNSIGK